MQARAMEAAKKMRKSNQASLLDGIDAFCKANSNAKGLQTVDMIYSMMRKDDYD